MTEEDRFASRADTLAAIERRQKDIPTAPSAAELQSHHELRQKFRRMINPGITRPNSESQALESIKVLLMLADNLLRDTDNPKFQRFKPTNTIIKHNLVDPAGALEYAIEMGFKPHVDNFQPYYAWNKRYKEKLSIGSLMLHEHMQHETERLEKMKRAKAEEAAVRHAEAEKIKMAFLDDRLAKERRDELDRQIREGRAASAASASHNPHPVHNIYMPGVGITVLGEETHPEQMDEEATDRD